MTDLLNTFVLVLPILIMAGIGWIAGRFFKFPSDAEHVLTRYVVYLAGPASLILAISETEISTLLNMRLMLATVITYGLGYVGTILVHRLLLRRPLGMSAFAGFSVAKFNLIIIGIPVILSILGPKGIPALVINAFASYLLLTPVTLFLHGLASQGGARGSGVRVAALRGLEETFGNPLIIGSLAGVALLLIGVKLPDFVHIPLKAVGSSVVPVGLVAVGMSIRGVKPREWGLEIWCMSLAKMLVVPAIAIGIALLFDLEPNSAVGLVLLFCLPSAVVTYALARELDVYARQSGEIVVLTTLLGVFGIPLTAYCCQLIWGI